MRIRIIKDYMGYRAGEVVVVSRNTAHDLIDGGYGVISKDLVPIDYKTKKAVKLAVRGKNG